MRQNNRHAVHRPGLLARPGGRPALPPPSLPASAQPAASCLTDIFPLFMQLVFGTRGRYKEKESEEKHRFSSPQKVLCIKPTTARGGREEEEGIGNEKNPSIHPFFLLVPSFLLPSFLARFIHFCPTTASNSPWTEMAIDRESGPQTRLASKEPAALRLRKVLVNRRDGRT